MRCSGRLKIAVLLGVLATASCPAPSRAQGDAAPRATVPAHIDAWHVPSPDTATISRAVLYRPAGAGPFRLAVIAHASTQNALRRAQMSQPSYGPLAEALVGRGFAVLVPERPGHGATGGPYLEDQGGCEDADYLAAGRATAAALRMAIVAMEREPFIRKDGAVVVGHSAGGWGALALASSDPRLIARIVVFAPGRGGHAGDRPFAVCAEQRLIAATAVFGRGARIPVTWLVAANDTYFAPALSSRMAEAFRAGGDAVTFRLLPASGGEGHWLAEHDDVRDVVGALALPPSVAPGRTEGRASGARR
ncbi:alpha/beta fold hydrolase [Bradyrhizobium sp. U87765 SZCCT0131]|uniref:alpha/beta hydrolase family protein n=2 Tax=Bradyrhizobium TaxID=374 RepID=UPI001BA47846|nr:MULTISPECIES: alpha/beta fold hydrolase [unclassified Bradyrhizobium]MBR1216928.1 alpha/beta fold hydrolase [Bradyrhizobium sp. U87765 SZCCT0131]MBR1259316.1 alpha/beta fold hydrolase [Bradyrhizobium sp. U87765 SZCCT0134]MBR1305457.1 alpha/beta fold hydrolase [Bradyrhizobium sp. U87765 SZCCT0110]MBR1321824.1 alpha/beta fold hydrolase [Bradyrhizobium sp. U87765 SZCCT0109]MBR1350898.1 alpha/beta fold hydrolase [Bradyrhizobium sp. U87765 SZCCT0048]